MKILLKGVVIFNFSKAFLQLTLSISQNVEASSFSPYVVINESPINVSGSNLDVSSKAVLTIGNETTSQVDCIDRSVHYWWTF